MRYKDLQTDIYHSASFYLFTQLQNLDITLFSCDRIFMLHNHMVTRSQNQADLNPSVIAVSWHSILCTLGHSTSTTYIDTTHNSYHSTVDLLQVCYNFRFWISLKTMYSNNIQALT